MDKFCIRFTVISCMVAGFLIGIWMGFIFPKNKIVYPYLDTEVTIYALNKSITCNLNNCTYEICDLIEHAGARQLLVRTDIKK